MCDVVVLVLLEVMILCTLGLGLIMLMFQRAVVTTHDLTESIPQ